MSQNINTRFLKYGDKKKIALEYNISLSQLYRIIKNANINPIIAEAITALNERRKENGKQKLEKLLNEIDD